MGICNLKLIYNYSIYRLYYFNEAKESTTIGKKEGQNKKIRNNPRNTGTGEKVFFRKIWIWFRKRPVIVKVILVLVVLILLTGLCRLNFLCEKPYTFAKMLLPFYIPGIDTPSPVIPLHVQLTAVGDMGERILKIGEKEFAQSFELDDTQGTEA